MQTERPEVCGALIQAENDTLHLCVVQCTATKETVGEMCQRLLFRQDDQYDPDTVSGAEDTCFLYTNS